eukprot:Pgem_evm1s19980
MNNPLSKMMLKLALVSFNLLTLVSANIDRCRNNQKFEVNIDGEWITIQERNIMVTFDTLTEGSPGGGWLGKSSKIWWKCGGTEASTKTQFAGQTRVDVNLMYDGNKITWIFARHQPGPKVGRWIDEFRFGMRPVGCCKGQDFQNQDLTGLNLRGVSFQGANLRGSILVDVDMTGVDFRGADLTGAVFGDSEATEASNIIMKIINGELSESELEQLRQAADVNGFDINYVNALVETHKRIRDAVPGTEIDLIEMRELGFPGKNAWKVGTSTMGNIGAAITSWAIDGVILPTIGIAGEIIDEVGGIPAEIIPIAGVPAEHVVNAAVDVVTAGVAVTGNIITNVVGSTFAVLGLVVGGFVTLVGGILSNWGDNSIDRCRNDQKFEINLDGEWTEVTARNRVVTYFTDTEGEYSRIWWKCGGWEEKTQTRFPGGTPIQVNVMYDNWKIHWIFSRVQ